jgi:hypothetical protein
MSDQLGSTTWVGSWMKRARWKVSHFVRDDGSRILDPHLGVVIARTVCGKDVTVNAGLESEPTGIDTCDRCAACERRLPVVPK